MREIIVTFVMTLVIILVFVLILFKRKKTVKNKDIYSCDNCGELDCICHKQKVFINRRKTG